MAVLIYRTFSLSFFFFTTLAWSDDPRPSQAYASSDILCCLAIKRFSMESKCLFCGATRQRPQWTYNPWAWVHFDPSVWTRLVWRAPVMTALRLNELRLHSEFYWLIPIYTTANRLRQRHALRADVCMYYVASEKVVERLIETVPFALRLQPVYTSIYYVLTGMNKWQK